MPGEEGALAPTSVQSPAEIHPRPQFEAPRQPTVIIAGNMQPRLEAGGWFTRAFSTTSGVIVAILLFSTIAVGVPIYLVCGGCVLFMQPVDEVVDEAVKREEESIGRPPRTATPVTETWSDRPNTEEENLAPARPAFDAEPKASKAPAIERPFHTWTSGTYTTEAQFTSMTAGKVKLKKRDGAVIEIAFERLSEADQEYIRSGAYKRGE